MVFGPVMGPVLDHTNHQYRYTYLPGFFLDAAGLIATFVVFRKFLAMGGTKGYMAPE